MTKSARHECILDMLSRTGYIKISELMQDMDVSIVTLRNDLKELEQKGHLRRTRGGAMLYEDSSREQQLISSFLSPQDIPYLHLKEALAFETIKHIKPDDTIFLGSGSTFYVISKLLKQFKDLRIVTSNLSVAYELAPYNRNIYFVGGELSESGGVFYTGGSKMPQELDKIFVNKAFIGVSGASYNGDLTLFDLSQLNLNNYTKHFASKVFLVVESTKFGRQSAHRFANIEEIADVIITNREADERAIESLRKMNVSVFLA